MSFFGRLRTSARVFAHGFATLLGTRVEGRSYDAAKGGRLVADWIAAATSADMEIRSSFRTLIDRSRDLERNNDYMRGYLGDCEDNIVGAVRRDLRVNAGEYISGGSNKSPTWQPDRLANAIIEEAWAEWGRKGVCTMDRKHSWRAVKLLCVRSVPRDGNFLVQKVLGDAAGNRFGFALRLWEIDHLDLQRFQMLSNGNEIRFGIEFDTNRAPVAYWLRARHPGDMNAGFIETVTGSVRFAASEIYHVYMPERGEQSIGVPWVVSAITRLRQLGAFEEAAVIAARLGASKAAFFKKVSKEGQGPGSWTGNKDGEGRMQMDVAPGMMEELPEGWDVASINWEYPNVETSEFRKAMLRGSATGLRTSYITLGNDLESVNYSSARVGLLDERETWKLFQGFYDENFNELVFADWLQASILYGAIKLPLAKFVKFNRPRFKARRWAWVDPTKEVQAAKEAIAMRLTSRRQVIDEAGGDVEEVFHDNVADEELADEMGLDLSQPAAAPATPPVPQNDDDEGTGAPKPKKAKTG